VGLDITPQAIFGGENVLHIEIDNIRSEFDTGSKMEWVDGKLMSILPGIPGNVFLHVLPRAHATLPL
jgi:hypothetical protein